MDSISPDGKRLTTMVVTYPRFVHSELMTHRQFSRNAASSRAIPVEKMLERVRLDPVIPVYWGKNQKGMQAEEELDEYTQANAHVGWHGARSAALHFASELSRIGVHKQIVNRLLEPFSWITVVITATEWSNFFALRCHKDAQPELRKIAEMMREAMRKSLPDCLKQDEWHMPFINHEDMAVMLPGRFDMLMQASVARCARVSYLTHDGKRSLHDDLVLFERLRGSGHWSPFEHVARPIRPGDSLSNFRGWHQYRKEFVGECK